MLYRRMRAAVMVAVVTAIGLSGCDGVLSSGNREVDQLTARLSRELCEPTSYYRECYCHLTDTGACFDSEPFCREAVQPIVRDCGDMLKKGSRAMPRGPDAEQSMKMCVFNYFIPGYVMLENTRPECQDESRWPELPEAVRAQEANPDSSDAP